MQPAFCLVLAFAFCILSTAARAQARIEDCEKIQAADAYNQCLAKFGPTSKVKSVEPIKPGDVKDSGEEAAAGAAARGATKAGGPKASRHARGHVSRGRARHAVSHGAKHSAKPASGRKRMTIVVKHRK